MSKNNATSNVVTKATNISRTVYTPAQFLDKVAATSISNTSHNTSNFQYLEVADMEVDAKKLSSADFHFSKISNVKFTNCDFSYVEFNGTEFNHVSFENCKMERGHFNFAQMNDVYFHNCFLDSTEFDFTSGEAIFSNCSMESTEFPMSSLGLSFLNCNLQRTEINGIHELKLYTENSDFTRAEINDCTMEGNAENCIFTSAEFYGTNGKAFDFVNCKLRRINTEGSVGIEERCSAESDENLDEELEEILNEWESEK